MIAVVSILVKNRTGILSKVVLGLSTKGYQLQRQEFTEADFGLKRMKLFLKCPDKSAKEVEQEVRNLGFEIRVENVKIESKPASVSVSKLTENDILQEIARTFPDISEIVLEFGRSLSAESRAESLFVLGNKIGRATYKRDFALGSPLKLPAAWRRMIDPALGNFGETRVDDESITLLNSPFSPNDSSSISCCEFITGFIQGLLDTGPYTKDTEVSEVECKSNGAQGCTFAIEK